MRTAKNILQHELIGMNVEIIECPYPEQCNKKGTIVDETRNTLIIEQNSKSVRLPKQGTKLGFMLPADFNRPDNIQEIEIDCKLFIARPEDRVKKNESKTRRK